MAQYHNITLEDMREFLVEEGFYADPLLLPDVRETVFGKIIRSGDNVYSLRVFTGIEGSESRAVGNDAIRVTLFWREGPGKKPVMVCGSKRVHRVKGWKKNLKARIESIEVGPACPECSSVMARRVVKKETSNKGRKFWSCVSCDDGFQWAT